MLRRVLFAVGLAWAFSITFTPVAAVAAPAGFHVYLAESDAEKAAAAKAAANSAKAKSELCNGAEINCAGDASEPFVNKLGDVTNVIIFLVGAFSVLIIALGGLMYVSSTGDAKRVEQAKNTIYYAVAGLVIAILAYAIVNFVIKAL